MYEHSSEVQTMVGYWVNWVKEAFFNTMPASSVTTFFSVLILITLPVVVLFWLLPKRNGNHYS